MSLPRRLTPRWLVPAALPAVLAVLAPEARATERAPDAREVEGRIPALPPEYLVYEAEWAELGYHPSTRERVRALVPQLDGIRARLRAALGVAVLDHVEIRVAAIALEMAHLSPADRTSPGNVAAFPTQRLVVVASEPAAGGGDDLTESVAHGLAHLALEEATGGRAVPGWLAEGFADQTSGTASTARLEALATAALRREVPSPEELARGAGAPWAQRAVAADLVRWLGERSRGRGLAVLAQGIAAGAPTARALEVAAGASTAEIERSHRDSVARRFGFAPVILLAAVVWLIVATVSLARRAKRGPTARRELLEVAPDLQSSRPRRWARAVMARAGREASSGAVELGVPKVRRDGGWHTLH